MRTIPFWVILLLLPLHSATAQQARGLYLAVHGPDAPRSVGDANSMEALYFDARRGAFNTKTRFVILGGASANEVHGIDHNPARNRRMTFPAADVVFDETVGANNRIEGRYWNLGALPIAKGFSLDADTRRFVMLVLAVEGDDANYFDFVLSLDPEGKVPPPGASMFTYELTLRTPEPRAFTGEIHVPVAGLSDVVLQTFGLNGSSAQANIPFQNPVPLLSPGSGQWVRHPISFGSGVSRIGLQFQGLGAQNTFSVMATTTDGGPLPIPLPIVDFEPVTQPRFTFRTAYADTSCNTFRFTRLGDAPSQFRVLSTTWTFAYGTSEGSEIRKRFAEAGNDKHVSPERPANYVGDGKTLTGKDITHTYSKPSVYEASLMVTDNSGTFSSRQTRQFQVTISERPAVVSAERANRAPEALALVTNEAFVNTEVVFDGSNSSDPDGDALRFDWFVDGAPVGNGPILNHVFTSEGRKTVTLRVDDGFGRPNSVSE